MTPHYLSDCSTEFIKQVFPKFRRPTRLHLTVSSFFCSPYTMQIGTKISRIPTRKVPCCLGKQLPTNRKYTACIEKNTDTINTPTVGFIRSASIFKTSSSFACLPLQTTLLLSSSTYTISELLTLSIADFFRAGPSSLFPSTLLRRFFSRWSAISCLSLSICFSEVSLITNSSHR